MSWHVCLWAYLLRCTLAIKAYLSHSLKITLDQPMGQKYNAKVFAHHIPSMHAARCIGGCWFTFALEMKQFTTSM
jgi:hypothetical protein